MKKILLIDDDPHISSFLCDLLTREGYQPIPAYSGTEAVLLLSTTTPDLILLDLMLPGLSGETVLSAIRDTCTAPVIVVSARVDTDSKVDLLRGGAVDYVTKPFDTRELLARIAVHLRSLAPSSPEKYTFHGLSLYPDTHNVTVDNSDGFPQDVHLTRTEYAILKILLQNPTQVITKSLLLDRLSLDTPDCTDSSLKMHVSNLRRKLREVDGVDYIEAVWGIGFKMRTV